MQRARKRAAVVSPRIDAAGDDEEPFAAAKLQGPPLFEGAAQQRHVGRMLPVRQPDDPADAVRRAEVVRDVVALEAEHAASAAGELVDGGAAHAADANDDRIVGSWHDDDRAMSPGFSIAILVIRHTRRSAARSCSQMRLFQRLSRFRRSDA